MTMIEAFSIQILQEAVSFLFDECGKILQERRERRKGQVETEKPESEMTTQLSSSEPEGKVAIDSKDAALQQEIDETMWVNSEEEVEHLLSLLRIYTRNYQLAKEQYAKWGSALVPPIVAHSLTEAEDQLAVTAKKLQAVLSQVYDKKVSVPGVEHS